MRRGKRGFGCTWYFSDEGATIFSSQTENVVVEALEARTHLAATPLSAYYPLKPGWEWIYNEVNDGKNTTDTVSILSGMVS